jgi:hypothetical protein
MQQGEPDYDRPKESEPNRDHLRIADSLLSSSLTSEAPTGRLNDRSKPLPKFRGARALRNVHQYFYSADWSA